MSTPPRSAAAIRDGSPLLAVGVAAAIAAVIITLSILWMAGENHYRGCVAKAAAKFPAVPVSAYVSRDKTAVGPLKVSFVTERAKAVDDCHRF